MKFIIILKNIFLLILFMANGMSMGKNNLTLCDEYADCNDPKCFKIETKLNGKACLGCVCE